MSLYDEAINESAEAAAGTAAEFINEDIKEEAAPGIRFSMPDFGWILSPTGAGAVEDYINDPLNFDNTMSTARILRGCTGICGALNYAIIDIGLGVIEKIKERKPNEEINHRTE